MGKLGSVCFFALILLGAAACSRRRAAELEVEIPAGFTGNFILNMGVRDCRMKEMSMLSPYREADW